MKYKCLVVDDEKDLADSIAEYFNMFDVPTYSVYDSDSCMDFSGKIRRSLYFSI